MLYQTSLLTLLVGIQLCNCRHALQHLRMAHLDGDWSFMLPLGKQTPLMQVEMEICALSHRLFFALGSQLMVTLLCNLLPVLQDPLKMPGSCLCCAAEDGPEQEAVR